MQSRGKGTTVSFTPLKSNDSGLAETDLDSIPEVEVEEQEETHLDPPQPWVDVIRGNRSSSNGMNIEYSPPSIVEGDIEVRTKTLLLR